MPLLSSYPITEDVSRFGHVLQSPSHPISQALITVTRGSWGGAVETGADADTDVSKGFISKGRVWPMKTTHSSPAVCSLLRK